MEQDATVIGDRVCEGVETGLFWRVFLGGGYLLQPGLLRGNRWVMIVCKDM